MLTDLAARHPQAETVTVVLDDARYDRSRGLEAWLDQPGCRPRLVHLPCNAPTLDLIERFRHLIKRKVLFNGACGRCAPFKQAFDAFFARPNAHQAALESLITDRSHLIGQPETGIPSAEG